MRDRIGSVGGGGGSGPLTPPLTISGNRATGDAATVSGGHKNVAVVAYGTVGGGDQRTAPNTHDRVAGSLLEDS